MGRGKGGAAASGPARAKADDHPETEGGVKLSDKMTKEEREAIDAYSGHDYTGINGTLRGTLPGNINWTHLTPGWTAQSKLLDAAFGKSYLARNQTLYRGTDIAFFGGKAPKIGSVISDKGFLSTTRNKLVADRFASNTILRINARKGTRAIDVSHHAGGHEHETLLRRGTRLKVKSVSRSGSQTIIEVDAL